MRLFSRNLPTVVWERLRHPIAIGWLLIFLGSLFSIANIAYSSWNMTYTTDEGVHFYYSERLWNHKVTERASWGPFESKTPISLVNVWARRWGRHLGLDSGAKERIVSRAPGLLWYSLTLTLTYFLAASVGGPVVGWGAVWLASLDPNLVAHASVITVDLPFAASTLAVTLGFLAMGCRASLWSGMVLGFALGLAFVAKFSACLFLLLGLVAPLCFHDWKRISFQRVRKSLPIVLAIGIPFVLVVSSSYLFVGWGKPLSEIHFLSTPFRSLANYFPWMRLPLPIDFLTGIDRCFSAERQTWNVVILNRWFDRGVWYYFLVLWGLKTPIALMLVILTSVFLGLLRFSDLIRNRKNSFVLLTLVLLLGYFSFVFQTQVGYRYVLMCIPLISVLSSVVLGQRGITLERYPVAAIGITLFAIAEVIPYFGNPIAFTNGIVWRKDKAFLWLADSNLDWNQNWGRLSSFLRKEGVVSTHFQPIHFLPGHNTFTVNALAGTDWNFAQHRWLRAHGSPGGQYGHTFVWYQIEPAFFDRFLSEQRRLKPSASFEACLGKNVEFTLSENRPIPLDKLFEKKKGASRCLEVEKSTNLEILVEKGSLDFRFGCRGRACGNVAVKAGKSVWYRLEPGWHELKNESDSTFSGQAVFHPVSPS